MIESFAMPAPDERASEAFYTGAYPRIIRFMLAVGAAATFAVLVRWGWLPAAGFVIGCAISLLNFYYLKRVVTAIADRVTRTGATPSTKGVVVRFLLRYALIAVGAYVIFKVSLASAYGLLAGLFLPVAGIFCEAIYELYAAVRRGV